MMEERNHNDQETRESILKAAMSEFAERGYRGGRTASIAESAGVNKALIHYYFKNKESLYREVMKRNMGFQKMGFDIPIYNGNWELTPSQKLYILTYLITMSHFIAADKNVLRIYLWELAEGGTFIRELKEKYSIPRTEVFMKLVSQGIESGEFAAKQPYLILMGLFSMINFFSVDKNLPIGISHYNELYRNASEEDIFQFMLQYMFRFFRPEGAPLDIPEVPEEIISYLDQLIMIMKEKGVSEEILAQFMNVIVG